MLSHRKIKKDKKQVLASTAGQRFFLLPWDSILKIKSECCPTEKLFKACAVNYPNVISISIFPWDSILKIKSKYCLTEKLFKASAA